MLKSLQNSSLGGSQFAVFALAALAAGGAAALECSGAGALFSPYFGPIDPILALVAAGAIGALSLLVLHACGWFATRRSGGAKGLGVAALGATLLAAPVIAVDAAVGIDVTNAPAPYSLLFYPTIALVVEALFHLAPLALLFAGLRLARVGESRAALACLVLVSVLEPVYQVKAALADRTLTALDAYIFAQVWAVNLVQLHLFRRFGFGAMFATRLVYYLWWHIVWGALR
jgi:hypothetical protein